MLSKRSLIFKLSVIGFCYGCNPFTTVMSSPQAEQKSESSENTFFAIIERQVEGINQGNYQMYLDAFAKTELYLNELQRIQAISASDLKLRVSADQFKIVSESGEQVVVTFRYTMRKIAGKTPFNGSISVEKYTFEKRNQEWKIIQTETISSQALGPALES